MYDDGRSADDGKLMLDAASGHKSTNKTRTQTQYNAHSQPQPFWLKGPQYTAGMYYLSLYVGESYRLQYEARQGKQATSPMPYMQAAST